MKEKGIKILFLTFLFMLVFPVNSVKSGSITAKFQMEEEAITIGKRFMVRLVIASRDPFQKIEGYLHYDDSIIRYVSADDGISGGRGKLKLDMEDLGESEYVEEYTDEYGVEVENPEAELTKKTFEMVFKAIKSGKTTLSFVDGLKIYGEEKKEMSVAAHSLEIKVKNKREASGISTLSFLEVGEASLSPDFSKSIFQYEIEVGEEVEKLNIKALPTDENATITVAGNGGFQIGKNLVKVIVSSEGGMESTYEIFVDRKKKIEEKNVEEKNIKERKPKEEKSSDSLLPSKEKEEKEETIENYEEISEKEEGVEKKKVDRKNILFYGIMTAVVIIALIGLKIAWGKLKKLEEEK